MGKVSDLSVSVYEVFYEADRCFSSLSGHTRDVFHCSGCSRDSEELETIWECPQADGITLYTNKERAGCHAMTLKPLSVFPDLATMRKSPRPVTDTLPHRDRIPSQQVPPKDTTPPYQTE